MTITETRQLGIEFEKRILALDPIFAAEKKLSTDLIYSYLNEAQKLLFVTLYGLNIKSNSNIENSKYLSSVLGSFICNKTLTKISPADDKIEKGTEIIYALPTNYFSYIRSNSNVTVSYKNNITKRVQNMFLRNEDFSKYINEYFDQGVILRRPVAVLASGSDDTVTTYNNRLIVKGDVYTKINSVELYYYRYPNDMNLFTKTCCELPFICFEDIVSTAVQIFETYVGIRSANNKSNNTDANTNTNTNNQSDTK